MLRNLEAYSENFLDAQCLFYYQNEIVFQKKGFRSIHGRPFLVHKLPPPGVFCEVGSANNLLMFIDVKFCKFMPGFLVTNKPKQREQQKKGGGGK